jgi:hypothetical protein
MFQLRNILRYFFLKINLFFLCHSSLNSDRRVPQTTNNWLSCVTMDVKKSQF